MRFEHLIGLGTILGLATASLWSPEAAAKFTFPTNHPDLEWYTIETEHFAVHYPMSRHKDGNDHYLETEVSARLIARVSEEMWPKTCALYDYYLKERVHVVVLNQTDDLEGFTVPSWDWIEISTNPGSYFYRMRGRMEWFSDVLYHEFGHVISLKQNAHMAEGTQAVLIGGLYQDGIHDVDTGAEFFFIDADPWFWTEGSAEQASDRSLGNWWTSSRDLTIRTTVMEDDGIRLLDFYEWQNYVQSMDWNDGERAYQQGYAFANYVRQRFGYDVYARLAQENGKRWNPTWTVAFEDVLGIDAQTLYDDWVVYMKERYTAQIDAIRAEGEVVGRELLLEPVAWDYATPSGREAWREKSRRDRIKERQNTGTWQVYPRYDRDLGIFGQVYRGSVNLTKLDVDRLEAFTGTWPKNPAVLDQATRYTVSLPQNFMYSWDFVPGKKQIVVSGREDLNPGPFAKATGTHPNVDGYDWNQLWVIDIREREEKEHGIEYETWALDEMFNKQSKLAKDQARPIPDTLRASDPAVSPDGQRIAFLQYEDGTVNLALIHLDGSNKRLLTNFEDGTWFQTPTWSPDGTQIVVPIFKNYRQNLFLVNADGSGMKALTWDAWEEQDPVFSPDGKTIYFSADPDGVYNIFAYDLATSRIRQVTNVVNGAMAPMVTPEGNLVYTYYTAFGYKIYGLHRSDFLNKDVTDAFQVTVDPAVVAENMAYEEDLSHYEAVTRPYRWTRAMMPPSGVPLFRLQNDSMTNVGVQGGFQVFAQDYVEKHGGFLYFLLGEDLLLLGQYFNQMWYPNFYLMAYHYEVKYDYAYKIDEDNDTDTTYDQGVYEGKNQQYANILWGVVELPWSDRWATDAYFQALEYGFKTISENTFTPYQNSWEAGANVRFSNIGFWGRSPNPPAGRHVELNLAHAHTDVVYQPYGGATVDDGQLLDEYPWNKVELRWTEQINVPTLGGLGVLQKAREKNHRIQLDARLGFVDRNVNYNDEFRAGGQHPYYWGNNSLRPNTLFSGYPPWSLSGETMMILNAAYRFPIKQYIHKEIGPIFVDSVWLQIMGTAGNLWSFKPPSDPDKYWRNGYDERIAFDVDDIHREIPFVDEAYKNGNDMLYDAGVELRVNAGMFCGMYWGSFVRLAYGFSGIRGYGDVNGDDIFDTSENAFGDELSNEVQPAGLRAYIGLGTGW
ncbi:MAG: PD40 domain-containing protein [Deltaproteobacteria bacterium]|nr:PD40 domain-containing protein [Deltaproteobacteria bacterium]